ncbi:DUF4397 domain-containing protein [Fibrella sp. HMF5335]|uniref:DUF4397 domain-containing protein n=1 Tax=Fibrella rubiginis TaxID=2817060 RepID=A0A939K116_9BACT|nr:DUF4397 domain-containing protein [Fibrella rubiginis]MBO0936682.1 DUF4397 domain-containing protein [Fibrella rubiginis]
MKHFIYVLIAAGTVLASCEKNTLSIPVDPVTSGARLKVINAAPDLPGGVEVAANGRKLSAYTPIGASTSSPGIVGGITFGNSFPSISSNYVVVTPGALSLSLTSPATTTVNSATAIGTASVTLEDNKYYSLVVSGTGVQPETFLVNDDFSQATSSNRFYVRFMNLIPNGPTSYDLGLLGADGKTVTPLVQNIPYKTATAFIPVDVANGATLVLRGSGSAANIGANYVFTNLTNGRVFTVFARGVFGRTGAQAPALNGYINR